MLCSMLCNATGYGISALLQLSGDGAVNERPSVPFKIRVVRRGVRHPTFLPFPLINPQSTFLMSVSSFVIQTPRQASLAAGVGGGGNTCKWGPTLSSVVVGPLRVVTIGAALVGTTRSGCI